MSLSIALAQINPCVGDLAGNASAIRSWTLQAQRAGAQVVVFPEMVLTGYPLEDLALRHSLRASVQESVAHLAADLVADGAGELAVVIGSLGGRPDSRPTNCALVLRHGQVVSEYAKRHLPNYGVFDEYRIFSAGEQPGSFEVAGVRLGIAICEDIWRPRGMVAQWAGVDAMLVLNGSPYEEGKGHLRRSYAAGWARELRCPLGYVNLVGAQDDLVFDGDSFVLDAGGALVTRAQAFTEQLLLWQLSADRRAQPIAEAADAEPAHNPPAAPSATAGQPAPLPLVRIPPQSPTAELDLDAQIYQALVIGLRDYVVKNNFRSVALGLSGGIDSALVAVVAADAIGGSNVVGVSMPSRYSSDHSRTDAEDLAERCGIDYRVQPIEPVFKAFTTALPLQGVAAENLQARIRGMILMALSNAEGHLVLATGNKSELATGYSTIYGDAVGGFAPLKDVLKTRVWSLSRWRNAWADSRGERAPIPVSSIEKPPSAELRPGQLDQDSLPEYHLLDGVIERYVERGLSRPELIAAGATPDAVDQVLRLVDRAEWKRRQYPPGPKITALAFGRDRRLPITSRWREN